MNDPTRPYHRLYEIDYDRHSYDGQNWTYVNLPVEEIKQMAIASIKDSTMMYFSCDVGKQLDRDRGYLDPANYDMSLRSTRHSVWTRRSASRHSRARRRTP